MSARAEHDWDAASYDRVSDPQYQWALEQLERLELNGDETVLDAGCGSGRVTAELLQRLPRGRLYGVDLAPSMVTHTRERLGAGATILCQDLVELELPEPVDVVFSNATFHWISDHDALFAALHRALRAGGRLLAQCGGEGNIASFRAVAASVADEQPFEAHFGGRRQPGHFAAPEDTAARLTASGFEDVSCWLEPKVVTPADPRRFVQTVCLVRHLDSLPAELHDDFVERVLERAGAPLVLDYVRLNMTATRPGSGS